MKKANTPRFLNAWTFGALAVALIGISSARADYQGTVLNDTPLAYYPLNLAVDTGATAADLSGNNNPGYYTNIFSGFNNAAGPSPYITNAVAFDGLSEFVDLGNGSNPTLLNFSGPITMEAWVQPVNPSQNLGDILAKGYDPSTNDNEIALRLNQNRYEGVTYSDSRGEQGAVGGVATNEWQYVVSTYDGANWNMYVNGQKVGHNGDTVGAINFPAPWRIGSGSAAGASRLFAGNITQVALYNHALTPAQVVTHYVMGEYGLDASTSPPIISVQPQSQSNFIGSSVTFSVSVLSTLPTTNQWYKGSNPITGQTNATLTLTNLSAGDEASYSVVVGNNNGKTNSDSATFTLLTSGNSLEWSSADVGNNGLWDNAASANWINLSNSQQTVFNPADQVFFDDTVDAPTTVTINDTVLPSVVTVNSSTNNYTFSGSGAISGGASLVKKGSSTLTIDAANFTGPVRISGGTVYAGNNSFKNVASVTITNNSTLDFGGGGYNDLPIIVSGTGMNGLGALFNSYDDYPSETLAITLAGDTTLGGSNRWDLLGSITGPHKVTVNWTNQADGNYGEWNTINIASNVGDIELAGGKLGIKNMGATFGNPSANFIVDPGTELDFWNGDAGYAKNFHVLGNGVMQILTGFTDFNGNLTLENSARFVAYGASGNPTENMNGAITLNGVAHFVLGDGNFSFTNVISGPGGFVWDAYNHQMIFHAANTYTGPTVIAQGMAVALSGNGSISQSTNIFFGGSDSTSVHLDASGRTDQTLTLANGQTLGGIGAITGNLVASAGSTIAPAGTNTTIGITVGGNPTGTISVSGNATLGGTTTLKLDGSGSNDVVQAGGSITYGGALNLVNISGAPYAPGDTFQIFTAGSYSGSFTQGINPANPGPGLAWQLNAGTLSVVTGTSQPVLGTVSFLGGNLVLSGSNGSAGNNFVMLTSTNLATPLTNWTPVLTNSFDSNGMFRVTNSIDPAAARGFYLLQVQ